MYILTFIFEVVNLTQRTQRFYELAVDVTDRLECLDAKMCCAKGLKH